MEKFMAIFVILLKEGQSQKHSLRFVLILEHFWIPSCAKLVIA
jgi:hypothetical protein